MTEKNNLDYVIIDGPPGIGCPVIASLPGVDCALIVTEPTLSGHHEARRVMEVAGHFNISVKLVVNKFDLNVGMTEKIEAFCAEQSVPVVGRIPFDRIVVQALVKGKNIIEYAQCPVADEVHKIWKALED